MGFKWEMIVFLPNLHFYLQIKMPKRTSRSETGLLNTLQFTRPFKRTLTMITKMFGNFWEAIQYHKYHLGYFLEHYLEIFRECTDTEKLDQRSKIQIQVLYLKNHKKYLYYSRKVSFE